MNNPTFAELCVLGLLAVVAIFLAKPALRWWRRWPWLIMGRPLRGATAIVESVTSVPSPPVTNARGDDAQLRHYYLVNVTIMPLARLHRVPWLPIRLRVVPAERWRPERPDDGELDRYCRIESRELMCGFISFEPDEAFTVVGKFDLRLRLSVRHDIRAVQFRYFLEEFGAFALPTPVPAVEGADDLLAVPQPAVANE